MAQTDKDDARKMRKVAKLLAEFRDVDHTMTVIQALAFCYGQDPDIETQRAVETKLGVSNAASSRAASYWSKSTYPGRDTPGPMMLIKKPHPQDGRYNTLEPNPKGLTLIHKLVDILEQ